jgi:hypothetical protein
VAAALVRDAVRPVPRRLPARRGQQVVRAPLVRPAPQLKVPRALAAGAAA